MAEPVCLRALDVDRDAEALHGVFGDAESCRYLPRPATASVDETRGLLAAWAAPPPGADWSLATEPNGESVGRITMIAHDPGVFEAACTVVPAARGRGLAAKALSLALTHVFEEKSARRVFADIDPDNAASIRTFERLGFAREGLLRQTYETHIGVRDTLLMAITASDPRPWRIP